VKRCRQGRAESKAEKQSSADANNSADNCQQNRADGEIFYRGLQMNGQGGFAGVERCRRSMR